MNPRLQLSTTLQHRKIEFASMFPPAVSGLENPHTFVAADCGVFKMLCLNVASEIFLAPHHATDCAAPLASTQGLHALG